MSKYSGPQKAAPTDSDLMLAWKRYQASDEYANTKKWVTHEEHAEGSLWAAFVEGFVAAQLLIEEQKT